MRFDPCQTIPNHSGTFESVREYRISLSIRALIPVEDVLGSCLNFGLINDTKSICWELVLYYIMHVFLLVLIKILHN